jgi:hypothetical protein
MPAPPTEQNLFVSRTISAVLLTSSVVASSECYFSLAQCQVPQEGDLPHEAYELTL